MTDHFSKIVPTVSIVCIAYNQVKYIRRCMESIVSQKTNFPFHLLIHDDCSPDGTTEIIREFEEKYPDIVKPLYEEENQYKKGNVMPSYLVLPHVTGKYVAFCEGDDYWDDPLKLHLHEQEPLCPDEHPYEPTCRHIPL